MLKKNLTYLILLAFLFLESCGKKDDFIENPMDSSEDSVDGTSDLVFDGVFFAQTHVQQADDELFKLISNRAVLLKLNTFTTITRTINSVEAILKLNGSSETISLEPPRAALTPINQDLGKIQHSFDDSFTAIIPKEWVKPGLSIAINVDGSLTELGEINVGAPNKMIMNMFDVHFFSQTSGDYAAKWKEELESKLPVSEIELRRMSDIVFSKLIIPPRPNVGTIAVRVGSKTEYQQLTGVSFDGEQAAAQQWMNALKKAAGFNGQYSLFYVNIYGVPSGGQAGGYGGVGNGTNLGVLNHELGHALSLPHWGDNADYPYRGVMHDIPAPEVYNDVHVGPTWAFDMPTMTFIPPIVQDNSVGGEAGTYKKDPMQGGGSGDQEEGFLLRHFSDYSMNQSRDYIERHIVVSEDRGSTYNKWDDEAKKYSKAVTNNGVKYAVDLDKEVISVMVGASAVTPQATLVYPPIGPYVSGLIMLFDPRVDADRSQANSVYCPNGGCDLSVRITQGNQIKVYMLPIALDPNADPFSGNSLKTSALNLPASDGVITKIELLRTPDAEANGMPKSDTILDVWGN